MRKFALEGLAVIVVSEWPRNVGRVVRLVGEYTYRMRNDEGVPINNDVHRGWFVEDGGSCQGMFQGWDHSKMPDKVVIYNQCLGISEWKLRPFIEGEPVHATEEGIVYVETPTI